MKRTIRKKSGKKFPPPYINDGKTATAIDIRVNPRDPKKRQAYVLENGHLVNCDLCEVICDDYEMRNEKT